jgi:beta-galactosidase
MAGFTDFEHFDVAADLDFASWDSYPLGFLASFPLFSETHRRHFMRSGDPDYVALHHDLYRACGRGRWWVMEQQPGPVNWAPYNPAPLSGMVRFWALEAFAHGAEVVSFFRWRQAPFGQEQYHSGLNLPTGEADRACGEISQLKKELSIFAGEQTQRGDVALVFDYEAAWAIDIQPQSSQFVYLSEVFRFYRAVRRLGLNVDVVSQKADLVGYPLILVPPLPIVRPEFVDALRRCSGLVVFGPRLGSKTDNFCIPESLPPGPLQEFLPLRVLRADSLPSFAPEPLKWNGKSYLAETWVEEVASKLEPLAWFENGHGALFGHERFLYLAGLPNDEWLADLMKMVADRQNLQMVELPDGVRTRRLGNLRCFFNYNPFAVQLPGLEDFDVLIGSANLPAAGVLIAREGKAG